MDKTTLGDRMKMYERLTQSNVMPKTPIVLRLDGKAFHTFTRGLQRPFDQSLHDAMSRVTEYLVQNIQGAVFGYTQSDEISLLIRDWDKLTTDTWFNGQIQKMVSISAAMATAEFNLAFAHPTRLQPALFDSRVFNLPFNEVTNYFIWRQRDAERNSVNMLGQHYFSHKSLQGKNVGQVQDLLMSMDEPVNWNDIDTWKKRGSCVTTSSIIKESGKPKRLITNDQDIPIFSQNREYIEVYLEVPNGENPR